MGARPSQFKKGGGFLNGVDGTITGYQFSDEFNGEAFKAGINPDTKKPRFHWLYAIVDIRVDGADEDVTITLPAAGFDDFEVIDDGHTLVPNEEGRELGGNTAFAKLITSLVQAGFPETNLPEDLINYECIIGTRVRFVQVPDENMKGKKNKKGYDYKNTVIDQVYDLPTVAAKTNGKTAKPAAKAGKAAAAPAVEDIKDLSARALIEIVEKAGGKIDKAKLSIKALTTPSLKGNPQRDDVRQWLCDDDNLSELSDEGVIEYSKKTQTVTAASAE